ncbi:MAG: hypothetical protein P1V19_21390 [Gimesia sp.]|nr:hypothetical protein [Gimesia sp.]
MELDSETITIYEVFWGDRWYIRSLSESEALKSLKSHWAYGEVDIDDDYGPIGTKWAKDHSEDGWRIVPRNIQAFKIFGEVKGSFELRETVHLIWQCPKCRQYFSEDAEEDDKYPTLLSCSCRNSGEETYYFVDVETTQET